MDVQNATWATLGQHGGLLHLQTIEEGSRKSMNVVKLLSHVSVAYSPRCVCSWFLDLSDTHGEGREWTRKGSYEDVDLMRRSMVRPHVLWLKAALPGLWCLRLTLLTGVSSRDSWTSLGEHQWTARGSSLETPKKPSALTICKAQYLPFQIPSQPRSASVST